MPTSPTELRELAVELEQQGDHEDSLVAVMLRSAADQLEQQATSLPSDLTDPTDLRRVSMAIAADYTPMAQTVWNAADDIDRLTSELAQLNLELNRVRRSATLWSMAAVYGDTIPPVADSHKHPNDMTVRGPTYCAHCGAPIAEHSNGVCLRFPAMQPPLA